jgi:hypothetical protein
MIAFESGGLTISCTVLYPEQFDALRRMYDCDKSMIESLARCVKWNASGGKSGSAFLKTLGRKRKNLHKYLRELLLQTIVSSRRKCLGQNFKQWKHSRQPTLRTCLLQFPPTSVRLAFHLPTLITVYSGQRFLRKCLAAIRFHSRNLARIKAVVDGSPRR